MPPTTSSPVLRTKLHRPSVASDVEVRPALLERLDQGSEHSLTLISAPAGYGKTTLASAWLESQGQPYAWLSLDGADDELRRFLAAAVAALRTVVPDAFSMLAEALAADEAATLSVLGDILLSELEDLDPALVLVLDDYHQIRKTEVHDLLDRVIAHSPAGFRLLVLSRHDPPLSLSHLRAQSRITELRLHDLELSLEEAAAFLRRAVGRDLDPDQLAALHAGTEGWPVGLRLSALALLKGGRDKRLGLPFDGDTVQVRDYLMSEVLALQPSSLRQGLLVTSVLERFDASLCDAAFAAWGDDRAGSGEAFLARVEESGLFPVSLDPLGRWYRYHHLFQELLRRELTSLASEEEIGRVHRAAARWHEERGLLEDSLRHHLLVPDPEAAARLVTRHRNALMQREERVRLKSLRRSLPSEVAEQNVELVLARAWEWENTGRIDRTTEAVERVEALMERARLPEHDMTTFRAEIDALRCSLYCEGDVDGPRAVASGRRALERLPPEAVNQRAFVLLYLSMALQMVGEYSKGCALLLDALGGEPVEASDSLGSTPDRLPLTLHGRVLCGLCAIQWMEWNLRALKGSAGSYFDMRRGSRFGETERLSRYWQGVCAYHLDELAQAEASLAPLVDMGFPMNQTTVAHCFLALASTYQAQGRHEEADGVVESVRRHGLESTDPHLERLATAFSAELALRRGRITEAVGWERGQSLGAPRPTWRFYDPQLTLARVLIAEGTASSRRRASELLAELESLFESVHNRRWLIETLALRALVLHAEGDEQRSLRTLSRAVEMAVPSGAVRLFVDLGAELVPLLHRLEGDDDRLTYVGRIVAAFAGTAPGERARAPGPSTTRNTGLLEPLSARELEVLELLAQRLSNREIGERLFISAYTVKSHARAIFGKLGVHGRRAAAAKATGLGILPA